MKRALLKLSDYTEDFLRLSLQTIVASTKIKRFDIEFHGYIQDFQIIHEQFETSNKKKLYFYQEKNNGNYFI